MKTISILAGAILLVLVGGGSFFGGIQYQKKQLANNFPGRNFQMNGARLPQGIGNRNGGQDFRPIMGEIASLDENTLTISTMDQGNKLVTFSDVTKITKSSEASVSDLLVGETVNVFGTTDSTEASIQAQSIAIGNAGFNRLMTQTP